MEQNNFLDSLMKRRARVSEMNKPERFAKGYSLYEHFLSGQKQNLTLGLISLYSIVFLNLEQSDFHYRKHFINPG